MRVGYHIRDGTDVLLVDADDQIIGIGRPRHAQPNVSWVRPLLASWTLG